jgi:hypothetical protein
MNRLLNIGCGLALLLTLGIRVATAEGLRSLNLGTSEPVPARPVVTEDNKGEYLSMGREYLRTYLRSSLRKMLQEQGVTVEFDPAQTGAAMDLTPLYGNAHDLGLSTRVHVWAKEDVQSYLTCGRELPVRLEMDSSLQMSPRLEFLASFQAPLDSLFEMELGSRFKWTEGIDSRIATTLRNSDRLYTGVSAGVAVALSTWRLDVECRLDPDSVLMQRLNLGTSF